MLHILLRLPLQLVDPRGRSSRTDFLHVAIAMFVLQLVCLAVFLRVEEEVGRLASLPVNLAFLYMALCATTRRLHDIGRSALWMPIAALVWGTSGTAIALVLALLLGPSRLQPGAPVFWVVFLLLLVPPLLAALWLHLAESQPEPNRFGPAPREPETPRAAPAPQGRGSPRRLAAHA